MQIILLQIDKSEGDSAENLVHLANEKNYIGLYIINLQNQDTVSRNIIENNALLKRLMIWPRGNGTLADMCCPEWQFETLFCL